MFDHNWLVLLTQLQRANTICLVIILLIVRIVYYTIIIYILHDLNDPWNSNEIKIR